MTAETYHFDKGTEMPFKFQDRWVAGATGFKDIQDAFRHLEWREARRRFAEIAEKYDLDEHGLPLRGTYYYVNTSAEVEAILRDGFINEYKETTTGISGVYL